MGKIANAARHSLAYIAELTPGVTPDNPAMRSLRHTSCALNLGRDSFTSEELRRDRQISDVRTGTDKISGSIGLELSFGEYDDLLEACLAGTWTDNALSCGVMERSFTFERGFTDIGQYMRYRGCFLNKFSLAIKPNAMITGSFDVVGLNCSIAAEPLDADPTPSQTNRQYDSYSGELKENGATIAVVTGIDITLDNGINPQFVVFNRAADFVTWGNSSLTGNMTAFFQNADLIQRFLSEAPVALQFTLGGAGEKQYTFVLPRIHYTGAENSMGSEGPLSISMPFSATLDPVTGTNLTIQRKNA